MVCEQCPSFRRRGDGVSYDASTAYPRAGHTSPSVYAALDVTSKSEALQKLTDDAVQLAVWTTTPWTLPANLAVAVNGDLTYAEIGRAHV